MFNLNLFKKKSLEDQLLSEYEKLMSERNQLQDFDGNESRIKFNEAQRILNKIESLKNAY
ncbi:Lacal_2735 family protein [Tenacibaculum agarivorans]|uniref:Lacal_2735 family protein n=1 Tax=Tenacibaculum agarivorans TaxID=1908389 RepID=UPI00094BA2A6|nr:Lacal_2735 family protein [Tenacibaculum agarivorans]